MGYSDRLDHVRVDFFDPTGKWRYTEAVEWTGAWSKEVLIHTAFAVSIRNHCLRPDGGYRLRGLIAVCLEPYHELAFPLMEPVDRLVNIAEKTMRGQS